MEENFYDKIRDKIFRRISKEIGERENILDLGCGDCRLAFFLVKDSNRKVTGIDLYGEDFPSILEKVKEEGIIDRLRCVKKNASDLGSFSRGSFGAVVSMYSLHEFQSAPKALKEAFKILKRHGKIVIVDFIKGSLADRLWGERYYTSKRIEEMMKKAGFEDIEFQPLSKEGPVIFTGIKDVRNR
ncbi:2-methoxy-6-polyprenyl-1,4-benzoquinol methylase [subsurface metagenome]